MRAGAILARLSRRAPDIVILTLCAALLGEWIGVPVWLAKGGAIIVGVLALLLLAARKRRPSFNTYDETGNAEDKSWIAYELAGKGTPPGSYLLGFFSFLTIVLTGFQSAYAMLAWAGFALGVVWGIVNVHYPADEESEQ
ncbi:MAG: hypothetical protein ABIT68_01015 [Sphingomicrobium sp.]